MIGKLILATLLLGNVSRLGNGSGDTDYYIFTNFSMSNYFEHLSSYSPCNAFGTCSAVAIAQVLNYYDTFHNDDIVLTQFEDYDTNITSLNAAYQVAPGVRRVVVNTNSTTLFDYVDSSYMTDYQSYLLRQYNMMRSTYTSSLMTGVIGIGYRQSFMNYLLGYDQVNVTVVSSSSQSYLEQQIKDEIDAGRPVVVWIKNSNDPSSDGHEVVAYSYDSTTIYANYGWESSDTHINLFSYSFNTIHRVIKYDFSSFEHYHSDNYKIRGIGYCGCNPNNNVY